jgi:hypothetical protein
MWRVLSRKFSKSCFTISVKGDNMSQYRSLPFFPEKDKVIITELEVLIGYRVTSNQTDLVLPIRITDNKNQQYQTFDKDWSKLLAIYTNIIFRQGLKGESLLPLIVYQSKIHWILQIESILGMFARTSRSPNNLL